MRTSNSCLLVLAISVVCNCSNPRTHAVASGGAPAYDASIDVSTSDGAPSDDAAPRSDAGADASDAAVVIGVSWGSINKQPAAWYASAAAAALADNIIYYQNDDGGWPKNDDMTTRTAPKDRSTIDNSATTTQLIYLAKVYNATQNQTYLDAFDKGLDYLFAAQYPDNGGWPQIYPYPTLAYQKHITYNDNAMIHVMYLLRDVSNRAVNATTNTDYTFVDDARVAKSAAAVALGLQCILETQIVVNNVKTGWCAQYDEVTLEPAAARAYELVSESGSEGAGILRYLMTIDSPTPEIVDAVKSAAAWFDKVTIHGIRVESVVTDAGQDVIVVDDPTAPPIWARFYEIGTDLPFFCGRDGVKKYSLAEIEQERRTGYAWYGNWPVSPLSTYATTWLPLWGGASDGGTDAGTDSGSDAAPAP